MIWFWVMPALYLLGAGLLRWGLRRLRPGTGTATPRVSVVLAARNEETTIEPCLRSLVAQDYPADRYEVLVADDWSTDATAARIQAVAARHPAVRYLLPVPVPAGVSPKKFHLQRAVEHAGGDIILTTDADCVVPPGWIRGMVAHCAPDVGMVVGYSEIARVESHGRWWRPMEALDFLGLMTAAAGAIGLACPMAASGRSLAYRRAAFDAVGGYRSLFGRVSGDDVLLLQLMRRQTGWRIAFAGDPGVRVGTRGAPSPAALLQQRIRWASNAPVQRVLHPAFFAYLVVVLGTCLSVSAAGAGALTGATAPMVPGVAWGLKTLADGLLLAAGIHRFRRSDLTAAFPLWMVLHPFYVLGTGLLGTLATFTWKGRTYT